jgi:peptidoglycan/xylan/chitin deacetylase (PgdA/CDA1 family)
MSPPANRAMIKKQLARVARSRGSRGLTMLIYHRIGGRTRDERDVTADAFRRHARALSCARVLPLDGALDELAVGDDRPKVVITFDDGFEDVATTAWPILAEHGLPFTVYLATAYVGGTMHWDGSTATAAGPALTWDQIGDLVDSGLCTLGNHTHVHARPEKLTTHELDRCTAQIRSRVGITPRHFAYPWGLPVQRMERAVRERFRSACTGEIGRNHPGVDPLRLHRVPVRGSDPLAFFETKVSGSLVPEHAYDMIVRTAKGVGLRA